MGDSLAAALQRGDGINVEPADESQLAERARRARPEIGPARRVAAPPLRVVGGQSREVQAISPLIDAVDVAWTDAWFRAQPERAVRRLDSALAATPLKTLAVDTRGDFRIAGVYAIAGRPDKARAIIAGFDAEVRDTTVRRSFEPARHGALAEIAIAEHRARDAINEVRLSRPTPGWSCGRVRPVLLRESCTRV